MDKEEFKIRLDIKTGDPDVDLYIWELHNYLIAFSTASITQLIIALDHLSMKLVDDLDKVGEGEFNDFTILSNDKDDKIFDRLITLISKIKDFENVSKMAVSMRPKIADEVEKLDKGQDLVIEGVNIFEEIAAQISSRKK